jgi:hypothetical protein
MEIKFKFKLATYSLISSLTLFSANSLSQVSLQLEAGITVTDENLGQIASTSHEYARARKSHKSNNDGGVISFLRKSDSNFLFSLSRNGALHLTDFEARQSLGRWPLARWQHEFLIPEITERLAKERAFDPEPTPAVGQRASGIPYSGCLSKIPLRYGDIDGNSSKELVLLMDKDLIFFSPDQKKIIFQLRWLDERFGGYFDEEGEPIVLAANDTSAPQYNDPYGGGPMYKGLRAYAKMYPGEFNENQTRDIVVWYKVYESNMMGQPAGFTKVRDTVRHYELITSLTDGQQPTGEYLPMSTSESTIREWLSDNDLTWRKGYPNLSECPGQTDKHISEMIDPLLNDPDVLN